VRGSAHQVGTPRTGASTQQNGSTAPRAIRTPDEVVRVGGVVVAIPADGTYRYDGSGSEKVDFGGASPCAWDIEDVPLVVKGQDGGRVVADWTYSGARQERHISSFTRDGWYTDYVGAAVTCLGVRRTEESNYEPHARRVAFPLAIGSTWNMTSRAGERNEEIDGKILRKERVTVPAGTFDTFVVHLLATMSGNSTGTYETTLWFAPSMGLPVKQIARTDVSSSGAKFHSTMTLLLRSAP
jgi:hypothetical protein